MAILIFFFFFSISVKKKIGFYKLFLCFFYFSSIPRIPTPIPRILTPTLRIPTQIPRIPTLFLGIPSWFPTSPPHSPHSPHSHLYSPHSHPDSPHSQHSPHSIYWFPIPAFTNSLLYKVKTKPNIIWWLYVIKSWNYTEFKVWNRKMNSESYRNMKNQNTESQKPSFTYE